VSALASPQRATETLFDLDAWEAAGLPEAPFDAHGGASGGSPAATVEEGRAGDRGSSDAPHGAHSGGPRLDDLVASLWEGLAARRAVECPVCAAEMQPAYGVHALPIGGRCGSCGSTLS
jgi:hypothetical protein